MSERLLCDQCLSFLSVDATDCVYCGADMRAAQSKLAAHAARVATEDIFRLLSPEEIREANAGRLIGAEFEAAMQRARLRGLQSSPRDPPPAGMIRCSGCTATWPRGTRFCGTCGAKTVPTADPTAANPPPELTEFGPLTCRTCEAILTPRDAFEFEVRLPTGVIVDPEDLEREHLIGELEIRGSGERSGRTAPKPPPQAAPVDMWEGKNVVYPGMLGVEIADPVFQRRMHQDEQFARTIRVESLLAELAKALKLRISRALCRPCSKCGEADPLGIARPT